MFVEGRVCVCVCEQTWKMPVILSITQSGEERALVPFSLHVCVLIDLHSEQIILKKCFLKTQKIIGFFRPKVESLT